MRLPALALGLATLSLPVTPLLADKPHHSNGHAYGHYKNKHDKHERRYDRRDDRREEAREWRPERYYRSNGYRPISVDRNTRVYRGYDDRYYCRRSDGTTGLIVGAALGGIAGNQLAPGGSRTIGTLIGAGAGALLGRTIERGRVTCR